MALVYIGLGSNVGDREEHVLRAVHEMRAFAHIRKISALSETTPVGMENAGDFINAVCEIETDFSPRELLDELIRIEEEEFGRKREEKNASREIDLDILAYDTEIVEEPGIKIPHPRMHQRRFVMEPMVELNPQWVHPVEKKSASELLAILPEN